MTNTSESINYSFKIFTNVEISFLNIFIRLHDNKPDKPSYNMLLTDFEYLNKSEDAFKKKIALQIKNLRRQNQVTQEKFYSETNINIARLESGKVDIRLDTLRKVCYYFDVSLSGFFHGIY